MGVVPDDDNRDGIALTGETETLPEYIKGTPPSIERLRRRFDEARAGGDYRAQRKKARAYYDGPGQLDGIRDELRRRGQPLIYTNRIRPAVNGVLGVLEAGRRDPRAIPRNPGPKQDNPNAQGGDDDAADVCTKTLRYINDEAKFNDTQMDVADNFFVEGCGAVIVEMVDDKVVPTQIRWEEFYWDKYARRANLKDARFMGIAKWKDAAEITETWRVRIDDIGDPMRPQDAGIFSDGFEDRGDENSGWVDSRRRRCMLVEEYAIEDGEWKRIVYIAAGVLEYGPSPYLDDKRRPCCPIEAVCCYVDQRNQPYGIVDDMMPVQDEVNASRSRAQHLMNSRQVQFDPRSGADPTASETARQEAVRADGVLPAGWTVLSSADMTQFNLGRMQEAKAEIERMGPTPAVLGRQEGASQSGRARLVSQQAGLTELARPMGRLHGWVLRCYEQMWNRARQFWTDPMWVRVTDDVKGPEFLKVNEPVLGMVMQAQQLPDGSVVQVPTMGVVEVKNRLAELDMDIILDQDEDTASLQQEVWGEIVQMVGQAGGIQVVFDPAFELMIEASPLADKRRILELIKKAREVREQSQITQMQGQIAQLTQALEAKQATDAAVSASTVERNQAAAMKDTAAAHKTAVDADKGQAELLAGMGMDPAAALLD